MRLYAIETISCYFSSFPAHLDLELVIQPCLGSLIDPRVEVQKRVFVFLCELCESTVASGLLVSALGDVLKILENLVSLGTVSRDSDLFEPFLMFLARLRLILDRASLKNAVFERFYGKFKKDERMPGIVRDACSHIDRPV
jgi:hypothetical protein